MKLLDRRRAAVPHRSPQTADQLVGHHRNLALIGHLSLDTLRHEFVVAEHIVLEVAVLGVALGLAAALHGPQRAHPPVLLELLAIDEHHIAGRLLAAGQKRPEHDRVAAGHHGLGDVAGVLQAAVCDDRHAKGPRHLRHLVDGGDLRDADPRHDPRGADRPGSHADLDGIRARSSEGRSRLTSGDVAPDHVHVRVPLEPGDGLQNPRRMAVRGVDDHEIHTGLNQGQRPLVGVLSHSHRGPDHEPARRVLGRVRVGLALEEVLDRDQPLHPVVGIHQRQLLDLVPAQQVQSLLRRDAQVAGHQRCDGHDVSHRHVPVALEAHVAVGDNSQQPTLSVHDRQSRDPVATAHRVDLCKRVIRSTGHRVAHHAGLGTLDHVDVHRLIIDAHVAVKNPDAADTGHRNGHPRLSHGVHRAAHQRRVQAQILGQLGTGVNVAWNHIGCPRHQQNVVKGEPERRERIVGGRLHGSRLRRSVDQTRAKSHGYGLGTICRVQLAEEAPGVGLDGVLGQVQLAADLAVGQSAGHAVQYLGLAL